MTSGRVQEAPDFRRVLEFETPVTMKSTLFAKNRVYLRDRPEIGKNRRHLVLSRVGIASRQNQKPADDPNG